MNKKSILLIVLAIVIVAIVGYVNYNHFAVPDNQVKVGAVTFTMPEGFYIGTNHKNDTNITNDYDSIFIRDCGSDNVSKYIKKYVKNEKSKDNTTKIKTQNLTVDNTIIYKAFPVNNPSNVRYWYEHDGEVYLFYNWKASDNFEKIVINLVMSAK